MATEKSFTFVVLNELELPEDFWNIDEIFRRIICWRQKQGYDIIGFTKIEVQESWLQSQELHPSDEEEEEKGEEEEEEEKLDQLDAQDRQAEELPDRLDELQPIASFTKNYSGDIATTGSSNNGVAAPNTSSGRVEIVTQKNAEDCPSCLKHFSPTTLSRLLESTVTGKHLLERGARGPLSKDSQKELVAIIADYHCQRGAETTECILGEYVHSITALFKGESKDTYFIAQGGSKKNPGGKLYNRIVNWKQKTAKRKWKEEKHLSKSKKKENSPSIEDKVAVDAAVWLQQNTKPWSTTLDKWTFSFPLRKSFLMKSDNKARLFKEYQHYSDEFGYQLIIFITDNLQNTF
ncbi:uncharacterized protein LOC135704454 [Ochlerotatus camptorhynchus]|uniref:uncharacterized protein LOC135704454 n=1 Tax=Ochlerotatus camptorhynchus TaxID=644619 RepID=UPI0031D26594